MLALAGTLFPLAAHAGENVTYTVDGEAFQGYRAKPTGASKGLVVIDIYHPKPPHAVTDDEVRAYAKRIGLRGLLAVDERWSALEKLWLRGQDRAYTSATLLVDREGVVRAVHRGGYLSQDGSDDDRQQAQAFERSLRTLMENDRL